MNYLLWISFVNFSILIAEAVNIGIFNTKPLSRFIEIKKGDVMIGDDVINNSESYMLESSARGQNVTITANHNAGVFYAIQSMLSLLSADKQLPQVSIADVPRFAVSWSCRSISLDRSNEWPKCYHVAVYLYCPCSLTFALR